MTITITRPSFALVILTLLFQLADPALFGQSTRVVVATGTPAPEGIFTEFYGLPVMNNSGLVAFSAKFGPNDEDTGIFLADKTGNILQIARGGQQAPGGTETFETFEAPALNNAGQVSFSAFLTGDSFGTFQGDGVTALAEVVRKGDPAPDANGTMAGRSFPIPNSGGKIVFPSQVEGTSGGTADDRGLFFYDPVSPLVQIVRLGQAAPDGDGTFGGGFSVLAPVMNDSAEVVFQSPLIGTANDEGIFRWEAGTLGQVARVGDTAPGSAQTFTGFGLFPDINASGKAALSASLTGAGGGIFLGDGIDPLLQIALAGQTVPGGNGTFSSFRAPNVNDSGEVLFFGFLSGTTPANHNGGLFRGDGVGPPIQIARYGGDLPDGNGAFSFFSHHSLNNEGQVVFDGILDAPSNADVGLYFYDDSAGLQKVAREGDPLLGSTLATVLFGAEEYDFSPSATRLGFNDQGEVTYRFRLADNRHGVAVWESSGTTPSVDATPPVLTVKGRKLLKTSRKRIILRGTATDASGIARVEFRAGKGKFKSAKLIGGTGWKAVVLPSSTRKRTVVKIRAVDNFANSSGFVKVKVIRL